MKFNGNESELTSNRSWWTGTSFGTVAGELEETSPCETRQDHGEPFPVNVGIVDGWAAADAGTLLVTSLIGLAIVVLVVVTVSGNLLVCVTITTDRKLRTATNYFLLSLAVADMMLGVAVLPVSAYTTLKSDERWPLGSTFCNLYISSDVTLCTASILVLFAISVDRYLAIRFPLRYQNAVGRRLVWKINAGLWVFSALVGFAPIHLGWNTVDGRVQNVARPDQCGFELNAGYALLIGLGTYFVPLVVMCTVYAKILQISRRQVKAIKLLGIVGNHTRLPKVEINSIIDEFRNDGSGVYDAVDTLPDTPNASSINVTATPIVQTMASASTSVSINGDESAATNSISRRKLHNKVVSDRKALVTLTSVVAAFAVCWIPYFALFVAKPFLTSPVDIRLDLLVLWLGYANSSVNPFLYAFHSTSFRDGFRRVLCRRCRHRPPSPLPVPSSSSRCCGCCLHWSRSTTHGSRLKWRRSIVSRLSRSRSPSAAVFENATTVDDGRRSRTCQQLLVVGSTTRPDAENNSVGTPYRGRDAPTRTGTETHQSFVVACRLAEGGDINAS